jgi:His-Xaa-Ser system protein HxsD
MDAEAAIRIDTTVHELEAVKRLCYALSAKYVIRLERIDEALVVAHCRASAGVVMPDDFSGEFENGLVDYGIRVSLARETAQIRDLIFRQAFVEADL